MGNTRSLTEGGMSGLGNDRRAFSRATRLQIYFLANSPKHQPGCSVQQQDLNQLWIGGGSLFYQNKQKYHNTCLPGLSPSASVLYRFNSSLTSKNVLKGEINRKKYFTNLYVHPTVVNNACFHAPKLLTYCSISPCRLCRCRRCRHNFPPKEFRNCKRLWRHGDLCRHTSTCHVTSRHGTSRRVVTGRTETTCHKRNGFVFSFLVCSGSKSIPDCDFCSRRGGWTSRSRLESGYRSGFYSAMSWSGFNWCKDRSKGPNSDPSRSAKSSAFQIKTSMWTRQFVRSESAPPPVLIDS